MNTLPIKFGNVHEIDKFLQGHKLPKLIQEEIENQNSSLFIKDIAPIIKNLLMKKTSCADDFTGEAVSHGLWVSLHVPGEYASLRGLAVP